VKVKNLTSDDWSRGCKINFDFRQRRTFFLESPKLQKSRNRDRLFSPHSLLHHDFWSNSGHHRPKWASFKEDILTLHTVRGVHMIEHENLS
jgi:hypothetical protein